MKKTFDADAASVRSRPTPPPSSSRSDPKGIPVEELPASLKPAVVIRDEMQDVLAAVDRELQAMRVEPALSELTRSELLTELARRGRRQPSAYERWMASEDAHGAADFR
uniref:Uncharacterized protein n=1 Tax=Streptomyces sp. 14R-10 TaxID=1442159 RepID=W0FTU0_9ACTN|nr:hypothetical protein [Streptomyces sp. 14R-10]AHF46273.1 hypothetical protein pZL1.108 [Streptomyces sp. 14R-10]